MSVMLVTLAPAPRWQRIAAGQVTASGDGWPQADVATPLVLAVPGEDVALHWLDLPDLAPAQAAAAARLALGDRLADPEAHIAVAPGSGRRVMAVTSHAAMAGWMAAAATAGWSAAAILPDTLLLPAPASGWAVWRDGDRVLARSTDAGFAGEADLAAAIIGDAAVTQARSALPEPLPLNLLVGDFAPVSRWRAPPAQLRRLGWLAAAIALLWVAGDVAALLRARAAASAADAETVALAGTPGADGPGALAAMQAKARARGAGGGLASLAAPVMQALAQRPGAGLASLDYSPASGLVAGVAGGSAEAQALAGAVRAAGLSATVGGTRATADASITDVTVRAQ